ncbi:hypothetical protein HK103_005673 [Boothiomyces macroporosus]|uniref:RhoGAP-domain-containing protein n=1 Tax=Boothiomyces macroporosus TaxID=261099 RepID=A0AAD5Y555_9FUNG|nr:hypothetical protein HK103_005673 [Boothiomyces macroporosus]
MEQMTVEEKWNPDKKYLAEVVEERDSLRHQNKQLWDIISKQKEIIQHLKLNSGNTTQLENDLNEIPMYNQFNLSVNIQSMIAPPPDDPEIVPEPAVNSAATPATKEKAANIISGMFQDPELSINKIKTLSVLEQESLIDGYSTIPADSPNKPVSEPINSLKREDTIVPPPKSRNFTSPIPPVNQSVPAVPPPVTVTQKPVAQPQSESNLLSPPVSNLQAAHFNFTSDVSIAEQPAFINQDPTEKHLTSAHGLEVFAVKSFQRKNQHGVPVLTFVFKIVKDGEIQFHIEKGRQEFVSLEAIVKSSFPALVPQLVMIPDTNTFSQASIGRNTGTLLEGWLMTVIQAAGDFPALLEFLSSNQVPAPAVKESFRKAGYLSKKGNYFGGWKTRFFSLDTSSGTMFYSDSKQGEVLGSFSLNYAFAAPYIPSAQSKKDSESTDKPGLVVLEYKKSFFTQNEVSDVMNADGLPSGKIDFRHVFFADSLQERDSWLRCISGIIVKLRPNDTYAAYLFSKTVPHENPELKKSVSSNSLNASLKRNVTAPPLIQGNAKKEELNSLPRKVETEKSYSTNTNDSISHSVPADTRLNIPEGGLSGDLVGSPVAETPIKVNTIEKKLGGRPRPQALPMSHSNTVKLEPASATSRPVTRFIDDHTRCMQQAPPPPLADELHYGSAAKAVIEPGKRKGNIFKEWMKRNNSESKAMRPVFGVTLLEATNISKIREGIELPAIVFRCIEYLDAKKGISLFILAYDEEGLYRLSGSSAVISQLRARFDEGNCDLIKEGDVPLLEGDVYYDPHAIAGLLKLFFRELSEPLFTQELRMEFFQISGHLLRVVQKSEKNKMTVRNVSIVFSPTLGVPAGLFTLLLAEYSTIFSWAHNDKSRGAELESETPVVTAPASAINTIPEVQEPHGLASVPAHVPILDAKNEESHSHQLQRSVTPEPPQLKATDAETRTSHTRISESTGNKESHHANDAVPDKLGDHPRKNSVSQSTEGRRGSNQHASHNTTTHIALETHTLQTKTEQQGTTQDVQSKLAEVLNSDSLSSNFSPKHPNLPLPSDPSKRVSYNEYILANRSENDVIKALEKQLFNLANDGTYVPDSTKSGSPYMTDDIDANNILDDLAKELL